MAGAAARAAGRPDTCGGRMMGRGREHLGRNSPRSHAPCRPAAAGLFRCISASTSGWSLRPVIKAGRQVDAGAAERLPCAPRICRGCAAEVGAGRLPQLRRWPAGPGQPRRRRPGCTAPGSTPRSRPAPSIRCTAPALPRPRSRSRASSRRTDAPIVGSSSWRIPVIEDAGCAGFRRPRGCGRRS